MIHAVDHEIFLHLIREARAQTGVTQKEVAEVLKKPQSFVSKYESGQRRLDIVEFLEVCHAIHVDPLVFIDKLQRTINERQS